MTHKVRHIVSFIRLLLLSLLMTSFASAGLAQPKARGGKSPSAQSEAPAQVIDLNRATESELLSLPGVGPSKARAILELRAKLKGFKKVEDLMRVKGIGRKTFRKLRPLVRVGK